MRRIPDETLCRVRLMKVKSSIGYTATSASIIEEEQECSINKIGSVGAARSTTEESDDEDEDRRPDGPWAADVLATAASSSSSSTFP